MHAASYSQRAATRKQSILMKPESAESADAEADQFIETMMSRHPQFSKADAEQVLLHEYGLRGKAAPLTGERDENFHVICDDGSQYVLKVSHPAEPFNLVDLATAAMRHVEVSDPTLLCPKVITNCRGDEISGVRDLAGTQRWARLVTWIDGRLLFSVAPSPSQRAACGSFAARLGLALKDFDHGSADRMLIWDIAQFSRFAARMNEAAPSEIAAGLPEFLARFEADVQPRLKGLRRQVIHGDMNRKNVVISGPQDDVINGVIDFGDVVRTCVACDLAVVASSNICDIATFKSDIDDVSAAYQTKNPLTREELRLLGPLVAMRLVMGILIPAWHQQKNPASQHYSFPGIPVAQRFAMAGELISEDLSRDFYHGDEE
jgi:hydroxylysine kinase